MDVRQPRRCRTGTTLLALGALAVLATQARAQCDPRVATITTSSTRTDAFARGSDGYVWARPQTTGTWFRFGGTPTDSEPGAVSLGTDQYGLAYEIFTRGRDSWLYHQHWNGDPAWSWGPGRVWAPGIADWTQIISTPSAAYCGIAGFPPGTGQQAAVVHLVGRRANNTVWYAGWQPGMGSSGFAELGGAVTSDPVVTCWDALTFHVFARGADNSLVYSANGGPWQSLGGYLTSGPSAVAWSAGVIDVLVRGGDDAYYWLRYNGGWGSFYSIGGTFTSSPTISSYGVGSLEAYGRGTDGNYHRNVATIFGFLPHWSLAFPPPP